MKNIYYVISLITGILIAIMITVNGGLNSAVGLYSSTVIIHIVGLIIMTIVMIIKKTHPLKVKLPWYLYLSGALGVLATVGNNYAFAPLGVSALLSLGLIGQISAGIIIDQFGLFGIKPFKMKKARVLSLLIMAIGAIFMIRQVNILAMVLSFLVGVLLVLQRVINANVATKTNFIVSTAQTYITGLPIAIVVLFLLGSGENLVTNFYLPQNILLYTGGLFGILTILFSSICVSKIPSYKLSVLLFIGQVFFGVVIDSIITQQIVAINLIGGVIITFGLCVDTFINTKMNNEKV